MSKPDMQAYKEQLYQQLGVLGRAFSSPKRLELLDVLCQGPRAVEELARESGLTLPNVSQHLKVLKQARLVKSRKEGLHVYYSVADPLVSSFWSGFRTLALNRLAEIREVIRLHVDERDGLEPIKHRELRQRMKKGDVVLLDVRPETEYQAGRIPGAQSIPLNELRKRLNEIPHDAEVVAYCRGPYCVMALQAVELLRKHGYQARRFEDGLPEWQARGLRVEK
jgi:rhodanese-related sulfurtransferase